MGALVRADATRAVVRHAYAREEPATGERRPSGARVVLDSAQIAGSGSRTTAPSAIQRRSVSAAVAYGIVALGQVDRDDVVRRARLERGARRRVDHVVGRGDEVLQRTGDRLVVVQCAKGLDVGH